MVRSDCIAEARESLDDAWKYIEDFRERRQRFFDGKPVEIVTDVVREGTLRVVRHRFVVNREVPAGVRRPVTACIGELRAILDRLVYGLSQVVGAPPSCGIGFPTCISEAPETDARTFDGWRKRYGSVVAKFPVGAVDLVHSLQPFNPDKRGLSGPGHILRVLNDLGVEHRHKAAVHVAGIYDASALLVHLKAEGILRLRGGQALEHNSVILEYGVPEGPVTQDYGIQLGTYVAFDKNGPAPSARVEEFLVYTHNFIRDEVVPKFEPFFAK